jgi:hypothetical protein
MAADSKIGRWARWQRGASSVLLAPLILSLLLALALYGVAQFAEVYIGAAEAQNEGRVWLGLLAIAMLSATLFFAYLSSWVVMRGIGVGYGNRLQYNEAVLIKDDHRIVTLRNLFATACAATPFGGIALGFSSAAHDLGQKAMIMNDATGLLDQAHAARIDVAGIQLAMTSIALTIALAGIAWLAVLNVAARLELRDTLRAHLKDKLEFVYGKSLQGFTYPRPTDWRRWMPFQWRWRMRTRMPLTLNALALAMLIVAPMAQLTVPELFNAFFVAIGPLATVSLALTTLSVVLFYFGNGSRHIGLPLMILLAILVLLWGTIRFMGSDKPVGDNSSGRREVKETARSSGAQSPLANAFKAWLDSRADREAFKDRKYPVFVIAAQGGGIYAATTAGDFFAKLQDRCGNFAQHVFAISAVSGGSLGSALFESVIDPAQSAAACGTQRDHRALHAERVHRVVRTDHLSGTVAAAVPDVIFNLGLLVGYEFGFKWQPDPKWGRDAALECSFLTSYYQSNPAAPTTRELVCRRDGIKPAAGLGAEAFRGPWPVGNRLAAPALLLNTTRSETGDRVAFAPFELRHVGDGTLLRFAEAELPIAGATLVKAAVSSARFPGMMPAKIVPAESDAASPKNGRWRNFVDGGYADSSGATTALEIYHDLRKLVEAQPWAKNVDLRLVLLTDAPTAAGGEPRGDGLVHAISPLTTLFSVRGQMARRAVKRAWDDVRELTAPGTPRDASHGTTTCDDHNWAIRLVMLDQQTFSLPLGWMISTPTADLIDRMIGEPRKIDKPPPSDLAENEPDAIKRAANIIFNNSCTMYSMTQLLAGNTARIAHAPVEPTAPITPAQP